MAELRVRQYTYTGRSSFNNSNARTIALSSFSVSGNKTEVKQIASIKVSSYHSSSTTRTWYLKYRLGGSYASEVVNKSVRKNNVESFESTFSSFPPVSVFNDNTGSLEILASTSSSGTYSTSISTPALTWAATATYPTVITLEYYDVEPTYYKPSIEQFSVTRIDSSTLLESDEGTIALATLKIRSGIEATYQNVQIYRSTSKGILGSVVYTLSSSEIASAKSSTISAKISSYTCDSGTTYYFTAVYKAGASSSECETAQSSQCILPRAFAALHISGCTTGGVSIGGFSSSTEGVPKFEVRHPAYLYGGIAQVGESSESTLAALGIQGGSVDAVSIPAGEQSDGTIEFKQAFTSTPSIATTIFINDAISNYNNYSAGECIVLVRNITQNGFTYRIRNGRSISRSIGFTWIAVGANASTSSGDISGGGDDSGGSSIDGSVNITPDYDQDDGFSIATFTINGTPTSIYVPTNNTINSEDKESLATAYAVNLLRTTLESSISTVSSTANLALSASSGAIKSIIPNSGGTALTVSSGSVTLPTAASGSSSTYGLVRTTSTVTSTTGYTACPIISGVPYYMTATSGGMEYEYGEELPSTGMSEGDLFFLI